MGHLDRVIDQMEKKDKSLELSKIINKSGFLFQLRVESEVESVRQFNKWEVLAREHPWADPETHKEGYIDLIIGYAISRLVIECKKTQNADWIFLIPDKSYGTQMRCLWSSATAPQQVRSGAHDFHTAPESYISEFCSIRGQGEDHISMLERLCSNLLNSIEALGAEEVLLSSRYSYGSRFIYFPVIVTNAQLYACHLQTKDISLDEGKLDNGQFEPVPYIRFRKSLTTKLTPSAAPETIQGANKNRIRTVLIVQASNLAALLQEWSLNLTEMNKPLW